MWRSQRPPAGNDSTDCANKAAPCATIQRAIDVAAPNDQVWIAGGTYARPGTVAVITKELRLIGGFDPNFTGSDPDLYSTVLDAQWAGSVISLTDAGEVLLQHLALTHGDGTGNCDAGGCGGGVYAAGGTMLRMEGCLIADNVGTTVDQGLGGGLYLRNGLAEIRRSRIVSNSASAASAGDGYGGGIYLYNATASLVENQILDNVASAARTGSGGGVYFYDVSPGEVLGNAVRGNRAGTGAWGSDGGGLWLGYSSGLYVAGNRIEGNWTNPNQAGYGGGVYVVESDAHLTANTIVSNVTGAGGWVRPGGGVMIGSSRPVTLSNNLIAGNDAGSYGGGVYVAIYMPAIPSRAVLVNNTIADNGGSGVVTQWHAALTLTNNIIAGHGTGLAAYVPFTGSVYADTNLFWNTADPITGANAIQQDPLLTPDYRVPPNSPAVDAGLTIPWLATDLAGYPRPQRGRYDLGAFEVLVSYLPLVARTVP